jgi:hypothetical protein
MKHSDLEESINSPTTALVAIDVIQCIHVGSFQTVSVLDYTL